MAEYPFTRALITGASSGIGEAMADLLATSGIPTVVVARRVDRLSELAAGHPDVDVEVLAADLTTEAGQAAVAARIAEGDIDLVVNNAGFGTSGAFHEIDPERISNEVELNVAALTRLSRAALGVMVPAGRGWLINVSSVVSFQPAPDLAVYAATKAYVTSLTESLYEEVRGTGVHVSALCPGLTRTEFQSVSRMEDEAAEYPDILWMSAEDVAATALDDVVANRALSIPGLHYKAMSIVTNSTPRWLRRRISALVQRR